MKKGENFLTNGEWLIKNHFSICHNVFKSRLLHMHLKCGKGLTQYYCNPAVLGCGFDPLQATMEV